MIVRETQDNFIFITQHDHAYISGEFFANLKKEFIPLDYHESLKFAIHQHDRAWIKPDAHPFLNDFKHYPYTFLDYPEKLSANVSVFFKPFFVTEKKQVRHLLGASLYSFFFKRISPLMPLHKILGLLLEWYRSRVFAPPTHTKTSLRFRFQTFRKILQTKDESNRFLFDFSLFYLDLEFIIWCLPQKWNFWGHH